MFLEGIEWVKIHLTSATCLVTYLFVTYLGN